MQEGRRRMEGGGEREEKRRAETNKRGGNFHFQKEGVYGRFNTNNINVDAGRGRGDS
jgi:hypothetical protein